MDHFNAMENYGIEWESETLLALDCSDDLSVIPENVSKMNDFL